MSKKFKKLIPKVPLFKRNTYTIPESYSRIYLNNNITSPDEQKALFYVTQFGGFQLKKIPSYFKEKEKFFSRWFKEKQEFGKFQFKANPNFISEFGEMKIEPLERENYGKREYTEKFLMENNIDIKEAREIEYFLEELNDFYSSLRVSLKIPTSGITFEDKIDLSRFNSVPNFQYKPLAGNRLFHSGPGSSFQGISSSLRHFLTINGEKTTEIDISASTIQFMNLVLEKYTGNSPMSKRALSSGDPYQYFLERINSIEFKEFHNQMDSISRDSIKSLLYTLVYSPINNQERNINRFLRLNNQNYNYSDLKSEFPEFFNCVEKIKSIPLDVNGNKTNNNFPAHLLIFKEESRYAREVLKRCCLENNFPVLPLHDSFITPSRHYLDLEKVIKDTSNEFYDYVLSYKKKF